MTFVDLPVTTARLVLRRPTLDDIPAIAEYRNREDTHRYQYHGAMTLDEWHQRMTDQWLGTDLVADNDAVVAVLIEQTTGRLVGDAVLFLRSVAHRGGEIGYCLHPDARGRGYITEAAQALLRIAFETVGLHRIVGRIDARNDASAAVLRRLGMRQEAHLIENEWVKGEWTDEIVFALLADEWRVRQP